MTSLWPATAAFAQTQVQGRVTDQAGAPLSFANVILLSAPDSTFVVGAVADEQGAFQFDGLSPGDFQCTVSMVGYPTSQSVPFQLLEQPGIKTLGDIMLSGSADLAEVEVVARKAMVEARAGMLVFNVSASPSNSGLNGLDLLRRAPGVSVDMDNNILLLGKAGVQIHINGSPSRLSGSDLATFLQNMSSDNIEAIEIISNPSARYDAEGNAGIINLRLKKNPALGFNGNLNSSFTQGLYPRYSNGLTLNYGREHLRTTFELTRSENQGQDNFLDTKQQNGFILNLDSKEKTRNTGYNVALGLDAQLAEQHSLGFSGRAILSQDDNRLSSSTGIIMPGSDELDQLLVSQTLLDRSLRSYNFDLNYNWAISSGSNFSTDLSFGQFNTQGTTQQPNTFFAADEATVLDISNNAFDADTYIDLWSAKADYEKSWEGLKLSTGGKWAYITTDNRFAFFNIQANEPVPDLDKSNDFSYTERVAAAYAVLDAQLGPSLKVSAGLRVENTASRGRLMSQQALEDTDVTRNYTNFFPNLSLSFSDNDEHALSISVGRRITRPNYQNLNPFESPLSELVAWKGNPFLRPSYTTNYQATYAYRQKLTLTSQYSETEDFFASIFEITNENGNIIIPRNMARATRFNLSASYPLAVNKYWEFFAFLDGGHRTYNGDLEGTDIDLSITTWSFRVQNNFQLPWGMLFDLTYERYSDWIWRGSIRVRGNHILDMGIRKDFLNQSLQVRLTGADVLRTNSDYFYNGNYGGLDIDGVRTFDNQRFGAGITWKFGNQKVKAAQRRKGAMEDELRRLNGGG